MICDRFMTGIFYTGAIPIRKEGFFEGIRTLSSDPSTLPKRRFVWTASKTANRPGFYTIHICLSELLFLGIFP